MRGFDRQIQKISFIGYLYFNQERFKSSPFLYKKKVKETDMHKITWYLIKNQLAAIKMKLKLGYIHFLVFINADRNIGISVT